MQQRGIEQLAKGGFERYEISAYAQKGERCRHNLNYWQFGDYLGIGAGAHGKITSPNPFAVERSWKRRHPDEYMANSQSEERIAGHQQLSRDDLILEFMMNALRLVDGFDESIFGQHTGLPVDDISEQLERATERGMLQCEGDRIVPTDRGINYLNDLLQIFAD